MNPLWIVQTLAVLRLELRKTFFSKRGFWIYLLALAPVMLFTGDSIVQMKTHLPCDFGHDANIFATIFQFFFIRLGVFFGCVGIFMNLFRGEVLDRSLHYYFLAPLRREVLLAGKFLARLLATCVFFTTSTFLPFWGLYLHFRLRLLAGDLTKGE